MTRIRAIFTRPSPFNEGSEARSGTMVATLYEITQPNDAILVVKYRKKKLVDGLVSIELDPTEDNQAWELKVVPSESTDIVRMVKIPEDGPVNWEDLKDANPTTLKVSSSEGTPGPPGKDSTVPGPPGKDSTVPGPPGPPGDDKVPDPSSTGTFTLQSVDGVISWVEVTP